MISDHNGPPLKPDKWKMDFLPPLGIEDNAKFSTAFILKVFVIVVSTRQYLYLLHG